jgi:hypothetical protein
VVIVVGTFLPWLKSGSAQRNSYQAGGAMRRLLDVHGLSGAGLTAWPFVGLACASVVVVFAAGLPRAGAALGLLVGAAAGAVSIGVLTADRAGFLQPANTGPVVTLIGAAFVAASSTVCLLARR